MSIEPLLNIVTDKRLVTYAVYRCAPMPDRHGVTMFPIRAEVRYESAEWLGTTVYGASETGPVTSVTFDPDPERQQGFQALADAPAWVQQISREPGLTPTPQVPESVTDAELDAIRLTADAGFLPIPDDQKKSFLLRQALLMHGVPSVVLETSDEDPIMQSLMKLPVETVMVLVRWIFLSGAVGMRRGQEHALKALRRRFEPEPGLTGEHHQDDERVIGSINVLLTEFGIWLRP